ncbi:MAG: winged helix-turn-helix transcriptional regulator [Anaerolineae bacterium]|nr:winged helix-turn-helix transcriptional regulator [Anaerolineae bacterium]
MPDLIAGPAPVGYQFMVSLPHSVLGTASLVCAAPRFEGLAERLSDMRGALPAALRDELCLLMTFAGGYQRFAEQIMAHLPATATDMEFDEFWGHLEATPEIHYQWMALCALGRGAVGGPASQDLRKPPAEMLDLADTPDQWAEYLRTIESEADPAAVSTLVADGGALKRRLLDTLKGFWQTVYAEEFEATRPIMVRSVVHNQARGLPSTFRDTFVTVTGRMVPERITALMPGIRSVRFIPSCYVGPYVAFSHYRDELVLFYNCRSTPPRPGVSDGTALYPPLKALADETRLQILTMLHGKEMYAQEIVDQLEISQPAVSRHLNLMAAAGVLKIRRDGNAKFYSIDTETLARVVDTLRLLV